MRYNNMVVLVVASPALAAAFPWLPLPFVKRPEKSWTPPSETQAVAGNVDVKHNYSPRPTGDAGDALGKMELVKRIDGYNMGTDTCGFIASSWSNAFTCVDSTARCANNGKFMGCCDDEDCSFLKTKCLDYKASVDGSCTLPTDSHTVCCTSALAPACYTYLFSTTESPGITLSMFACEPTSGSGMLLDYPPEFTRVGGTIESSQKTTPEPSTPPALEEDATPSPSGRGSKSETGGTGDDEDDDGPNVGAIVGGTIGGIAAIGIAGLLAFFFFIIRKGKKKPAPGATPVPMMAAQSPVSPGGSNLGMSPGGYPQGTAPQGYAPTQQMYGQNVVPQGYTQHQGYHQYGQAPQQQTYGQYQQHGNTGAAPGQYPQMAPQAQGTGTIYPKGGVDGMNVS